MQTQRLATSKPKPPRTLEELKLMLPEHIHDLFLRSCTEITLEQAERVAYFLLEFETVFAKNDTDLGCYTDITHSIDTSDAKPVRLQMRRTPLGFQGEEEKHLRQMLDMGVIRESTSEWAAAPVLVRKRDGSVRYCIDYRDLNNVTVKDAFPLPKIQECLDTLGNNAFLSTLDLQSGYWQLLVDPKDVHKTAFITKYGLFEHVRLPFGLCNSPATFSRAMQLLLRGLSWRTVLSYLDDVVILGTSFENHLDNLREVLVRLQQNNLKLKPKKCSLFKTEIDFLGRKVSKHGISVHPNHIDKVKTWPTPKNVNDIEKFLGFVNYHRDFIKDYAEYTTPLLKLTHKGVPFEWTEEHHQSFERLKQLLISTPSLGFPDENLTFILDTDASLTAIGCELSQIDANGKTRVISYGSYVLTPAQRNYCATKRELLAVVKFTRQYRHYLLGKPFYVRTDHNSLTWLTRFKNIQGMLARWLEELSQYDMTIVHRAGKEHVNADALSRIPDPINVCNCYQAGKKTRRFTLFSKWPNL